MISGDRMLLQLAGQVDVHPNRATTWEVLLDGAAAVLVPAPAATTGR